MCYCDLDRVENIGAKSVSVLLGEFEDVEKPDSKTPINSVNQTIQQGTCIIEV